MSTMETTAKRLPRGTRRTMAKTVFLFILAAGISLSGCSLQGTLASAPTNRYALVIGVQDYENINDLSYPDDDANEMAAMLTSEGWTVRSTLINGNATYANINADIAALSTDSEATILVYYSGHGDLIGDTPYILPYDVSITDTSLSTYTLTNAITPATLTAWLDEVPAKNRLLILDSCYSGGFSLSDGSVDTEPADYSAMNYTTSDKGLLFAALSKFGSMVSTNLSMYGEKEVLTLAACGSEEYSYDDSTHSNGAFTYYLLKAAASGDANADGYVTVSEAYDYSKSQIKANWNALYGGWPNDEDFLPHISGGAGDLVLYSGSD